MSINTPLKRTVSSLVALVALATPAAAVTLNLTNAAITLNDTTVVDESTIAGFHAGVIDGALFRRSDGTFDDTSAGSGNYRDLFRMSASGTEQGYNRDGIMDSSSPGGFNDVVTIGDLHTDTTGLFYVFAIDTNEGGNAAAAFLSLDKFQLYVGGSADVDPLPTDPGPLSLATLGDKIYDMDAEEESVVMLDSSISSGSGEMDLFVFVQASLFADLPTDSMVYLFVEFGSYTGASDTVDFSSNGGHEDLSALTDNTVEVGLGVPSSTIPEPSTSALAGVAMLMMWMRRSRKS